MTMTVSAILRGESQGICQVFTDIYKSAFSKHGGANVDSDSYRYYDQVDS